MQAGLAQSPILQSFEATQNGNNVYLRWVILKGQTCNGIDVERSTDSLSFQKIGEIPGVCGSSDFAQTFEFTDVAPVLNTVNYYRLVLGNTGFSRTEAVDVFDFSKSATFVYPNPAKAYVDIRFENPYSRTYILKIYSPQGKEIYSAQTKKNSIRFNTHSRAAGIYIFSLSLPDEKPTARGRFAIIR